MSRIRHYLVLALSAVGVIALVSTAPVGVGAAPQSASFSEVGAHDFVVPDGVTQLTVDAYGGEGASDLGVAGGLGGRIVATIAVTPGETLQVNVGGTAVGGAELGGWNGGGPGGLSGNGGGGASDVRQGGTALSNRVVVAGGGGGAGGTDSCQDAPGGGGGGDVPVAGGQFGSSAGGGGAGGAEEGGAGGAASALGAAGGSGTPGGGGYGGVGSEESIGGGGGGGGWYGGGGGGGGVYSGGGGGGSSYAGEGATVEDYGNGVRSGAGLVVLSWDEPATTTTTSTTTTTTTTSTTLPPTGPAATYLDGQLRATASPGGSITISSSGWLPDGRVTATMYSDPVVLGAVTADAEGVFSNAFAIPSSAPLGQHTIVLTGMGANGGPGSAELSLEIVAASSSVPSSLSFTC